MNTNSNIYTVVYTTIVVVVAAAILAFASMSLHDRQVANEKAETISQILTAAQFGEKESWTDNNATIQFYKDNIAEAYNVSVNGDTTACYIIEDAAVASTSDLKVEDANLRKAPETAQIPVYVFKNGVKVIAIYGAGLWGPVWGYIALNPDGTMAGAYFDHASETPGLGGKIKDDPKFRAQFVGKSFDFTAANPFAIVKGGAPEGQANAIDAISGATMTSNGVSAAINLWASAYKASLAGAQPEHKCCGKCHHGEGHKCCHSADSCACGHTEHNCCGKCAEKSNENVEE